MTKITRNFLARAIKAVLTEKSKGSRDYLGVLYSAEHDVIIPYRFDPRKQPPGTVNFGKKKVDCNKCSVVYLIKDTETPQKILFDMWDVKATDIKVKDANGDPVNPHKILAECIKSMGVDEESFLVTDAHEYIQYERELFVASQKPKEVSQQ